MVYDPKVFGYKFTTNEENSESEYTKSHNTYFNLDECVESDRFVVEQFTGLTDKNGKEIYEGDIVKYSRCHTISLEEQKNVFNVKLIEDGDEIGRICFIFPQFCWSYDHKRYDDIEPMSMANHRYEILGNINENPELLDMKN
jgi:uncharacterized phage protein (TIGR01671 family)